jgi:glycine/D-amino acid oxidase-like deaminating enzyme
MSNTSDILIIGAGLAGAAAAEFLAKRGLSVTVWKRATGPAGAAMRADSPAPTNRWSSAAAGSRRGKPISARLASATRSRCGRARR